MKVTIVLLSLLLSTTLASAAGFEIEEGAIELGGGLTFSSSSGDLYENSDGDAMTDFSLFPTGYYFVKPGLGVGGALLFATTSQGDASASILGIGPGVIYYFGDSTFNTRPFVSGAFMYSSEKSDYWGSGESNTTATTIHLDGGVAYMLADHYVLKCSVYFDIESQEANWDHDGISKTKSGQTFGLTIGFAGIIY